MKENATVRKAIAFVLVAAAALFVGAPRAHAVAKEIVQLQRDVSLLQQQMRDLQQSVDSNNAVLKTLIEQSLDAVSRMQDSVQKMEKSVQESQANTNSKVDDATTQLQSLRDMVDELRARIGLISQQMAETKSVLQSVDARLAGTAPAQPAPGQPPATAGGPTPGPSAAGPASAPAPAAPPSADVLYSTALGDFLGGKYDLARQEYTDYLKYYGDTQLAGNAQFYIGETYYHQGDFQTAIQNYDKVINNFPNSYKIAAAHLKKGYALLEMNKNSQGIQELRALVENYPHSEEAKLARDRLSRLGQN